MKVPASKKIDTILDDKMNCLSRDLSYQESGLQLFLVLFK